MRVFHCTLLLLLVASTVESHKRQSSAPRDGLAKCLDKRSSSTCTTQLESEEGPFYWDTAFVRSNITEGYPGIPLTLYLQVIDSSTCLPIENAAVDIWHCNHMGVYSAYSQSDNPAPAGSTYMRGIQFTNASGIVTFSTVFPGYYSGLDTHIHTRIHLNASYTTGDNAGTLNSIGTIPHTGRLFFNDTLSDLVDATWPYTNNTNHGTRTTLANDDVYNSQMDGEGVLEISYVSSNISDGLIGMLSIGVDMATSYTYTYKGATLNSTGTVQVSVDGNGSVYWPDKNSTSLSSTSASSTASASSSTGNGGPPNQATGGSNFPGSTSGSSVDQSTTGASAVQSTTGSSTNQSTTAAPVSSAWRVAAASSLMYLISVLLA